jgi:hypothetical protein
MVFSMDAISLDIFLNSAFILGISIFLIIEKSKFLKFKNDLECIIVDVQRLIQDLKEIIEAQNLKKVK